MAGTYTPRVLVVDDEEIARTFVARALESSGYEVVLATSSEEALHLAIAEPPFDLLLADVSMPGMRGAELVRRMREQHPTLRVLYVTAHAEQLLHDPDAVAQDDPVLTKPVTKRALEQAVSFVLFGHRDGPVRRG